MGQEFLEEGLIDDDDIGETVYEDRLLEAQKEENLNTSTDDE